jgi:hypothetical protein
MKKTIRAKASSLAATLSLLVITSLFVEVPSVFACTFAALKSVTLATDPPRPVMGEPFTLNAALLYGGGMGHGNMLTAAENAVSADLTPAEGMRVLEGDNPMQTTTPVFNLGYETTVNLTWRLVTAQPGAQYIQIAVTNDTFGQGQESTAFRTENGLLSWEQVRPDMNDTRVQAGGKAAIDAASLALMPSLRLREWQTLANGDILFTDADGTRYSVKAGELDLGEQDASPVIVADPNGNRYLATNGRIVVVEGPQVFSPIARPAQPGPNDPVTVRSRIVGAMNNGRASLFFSTDGILWQSVEMARMPEGELWQGEIPAQGEDGLTINYYLEVTDDLGHVVTLPRYSIRVVDPDRLAQSVRTVSLLTLGFIFLAIIVIIFWVRWAQTRKERRAGAKPPMILSDQQPLLTQRLTGVLAQVRRPVSAEAGTESWLIGFFVLTILGVIFTIVGILIDQFQIINLIIKMG